MAINLFKINWKDENYTFDIKNDNNGNILTSIKFHYNDKGNVDIDIKAGDNAYSLEIPLDDFFRFFYKFQFIRDSISNTSITKKRFTAVIKDIYGTITSSPENLLFYVYINDDGDYSLKVMRPNKNMETYIDTKIDIPSLIDEYNQKDLINKEKNKEFSYYLSESIALSFSKIVNDKDDAYLLICDYIYHHLIIEDDIYNAINDIILKENESKKGE